MAKNVIEEGIYFGLPEEEYHAAEGLSCSGIKQLSISPLNYWHQNYNPIKTPAEESFAMKFGKAAHCRVLEPRKYYSSYAKAISKADYPDSLDTIDDLKGFLADQGLPVTFKKKQDLIDRIKESGIEAQIWDEIRAKHDAANEGKQLFLADTYDTIEALANTLFADPVVATLFSEGIPEVSFFVRDPETGVMLKARMDYLRHKSTIDLKTFSNARGKQTDKAIFEAIYYEGYYLQGVYYTHIRELARQKLIQGEIPVHGDVPEDWLNAFKANEHHGFALVFVESSQPFDMRVISLRQSGDAGADANVYWSSAQMKIYDSIRLFDECHKTYGDATWRSPIKVQVLEDCNLPQLIFN